MSGWDKPSRPTWDPQDGPEDGTQAFPADDANDPWSQPADSGWGGSGAADGQDFGRGDFGAPHFGASDFGGPSAPGFPPESNGFPPESNGFPPEQNGFPPESNGFSPDANDFPPESNGFSRGGSSSPPPADFFAQGFEPRKPGATLAGRDLPGRELPVRGGYTSGPQASARDEPPWPGPARQEPSRQESARPDYGRPAENGRGDYGRPDPGRPDLDRPGAPGAPGGAPGQDFPRREPGRAEFTAYSTYSGQPDQAEQSPPPVNQADADLAARMDPALQDFFAPTKPDPRYSGGRPSLAAPPPGLPSPGLPEGGWADDEQPPPRRGDERVPRRPGRPGAAWEDPAAYPSAGPDDGPRRPRPRFDDFEPPSNSRRNWIIAIAAVLVVVIAGGAYLALKPSGNSNNTNATGPTLPTTSASASAPASTPAASPKATGASKSPDVSGSAASAGAYVLSAPSTAAGYPLGSDPHFLDIATSTAGSLEQTAIAGGGGTAAGSPVSASYTLPDEQTIEFVGYQGTFDPTKVMANLKSYGSSETTYPAGPNGGDLACANTTATASTPSGGVCFWVTKSTFGFTEFFTQSEGPEALNSAQSKGAEDAVNMRASVEKLKSS